MIQYHAYVLNQILFLSFYNLQLYNNNIYFLYVLLLLSRSTTVSTPFQRQEKRGGWISRRNSMDFLSGRWSQSVSFNGSLRFLPRGGRRTRGGKGWDDQRWKAGGRGKSGRVLEERTALASVGVGGCRIHPLSPPLPSIRSLFPLYGRASGQFEITLSPFQCVQSKLQFKSSLAGTPEL